MFETEYEKRIRVKNKKIKIVNLAAYTAAAIMALSAIGFGGYVGIKTSVADDKSRISKISRTSVAYFLSDKSKEELNKEKMINYINKANIKEDCKEVLKNDPFMDYYFERYEENDVDPFIPNFALENLEILGYDKNHVNYEISEGFAESMKPGIIYLKDYNNQNLTYTEKQTLAHEFMHTLQNYKVRENRSFICETTAELISKEFFFCGIVESYKSDVKYLRKILELVSKEAIFDLTFFGNEQRLYEELKDYISADMYEEFHNLLLGKWDFEDKYSPEKKRLNYIISVIFENKYGYPMREDKIMRLIELSDESVDLVRYYFNNKEEDHQESIYILQELPKNIEDRELIETETGDLDPIGMHIKKDNILKKEM